ncbi:MAG: S8 family serine peptidase [Ilumatobacter sp.]|nr:S8 family serine peptidase [Ilumatobacter sp.]
MAERNHFSGTRLARRAFLITTATTLALATFANPVDAKKDKKSKTEPTPTVPITLGSMYSVVDQIGARTMWERGITGAGVNVAVIDTGVAPVDALSGPDKVIALVDLSAEAEIEEATYLDTYGHGTHMAGIIAGRTPGADPTTAEDHPEWFMGVAPDASLISVKVGDNSGAVDVSQVIAGVDWVIEHADELDIRVLNLSFGSDSLHSYLTDPMTYAVERAWKAGIVVVVAAGNDGLGEARLAVPANDPYMISVGGLEAASNSAFVIPDWATNGNMVRNPDIGAPGTSIESLRSPGSRADLEHPTARVGDDLFLGSGSSQAAAVTSGAAALLLQEQPSLTPDQVKAKLKRGADAGAVPFASEIYRGEGLLRVDVASSAPTFLATQLHPAALGTGSLHGSRGSASMTVLGITLEGEVTVLGNDWLGSSWTGSRWTGSRWTGSRWTDAEWMGSRWTGASWTGSRWTGSRWTGADWAGSRWTGAEWNEASWSGSRWTGSRWTGSSWSGSRWTGSSWSSAGWS